MTHSSRTRSIMVRGHGWWSLGHIASTIRKQRVLDARYPLALSFFCIKKLCVCVCSVQTCTCVYMYVVACMCVGAHTSVRTWVSG